MVVGVLYQIFKFRLCLSFRGMRLRLIILAVVILAIVFSSLMLTRFWSMSGEVGGRSVAVTWGLLGEIVYRLGGGEIEVVQLLSPGVEIHDWEPAPQTVKEVSRARLLIWTLEGLDDWAQGLAEATGVESFEAAKRVQLLHTGEEVHGGHTGYDVHFWLNPLNVKIVVEDVAERLASEFPDLAPKIRENAAAFIGELEAFHQEALEELRPYRGRIFVTQHDSFRYFAATYGLNAIAVLGPEEEEPTPQHLGEVIEVIKGLCIIYAEDGVVSPVISSLSREYGVEVMMLYTGEALTIEDVKAGKGYVYLMRSNIKALVEGFECG